MRRQGRRASRGIDITPLIDVLFMLIIFFVLTTAFVQGSIEVALPAGSPPPISANSPIVVSVGPDSSISWAGERIAFDELRARAEAAVAASEEMLVAGDRDARYGEVAAVLDELRLAGVEAVSIAFDGAER